jgi:hypothetical protein
MTVMSGENQYVHTSPSERIRYSLAAQPRDTVRIFGTVDTLVNCQFVSGPLQSPTYQYSPNLQLNITGDAAPAGTDFGARINATSPFQTLTAIPTGPNRSVVVEGFLIKFQGTVSTSIEVFVDGEWWYVLNSSRAWPVSFQLFWLKVTSWKCHPQGIIT